MEQLNWLFQFLFYFFQYQVACSSPLSSFSYSSSSTTHHLCPHDQRSALLYFKHSFTIKNDSDASFICDYEGSPSYPKTASWNKVATDCCSWEGVTCDGLTGNVIGLDLSCSQLHGTVHPNNSLFQLSHLQHLNLAFNDFNQSHISFAFSRFTNLVRLNLSCSNFSGTIPSEIHHLSKLVSLDLSSEFEHLRLERHNFRMMLKNLTQLQELALSEVNLHSVVPNSLMNLSSLTYLHLSSSRLHGKLPDGIFHLPNLQMLILGGNHNLTGNLPKVNWSCSNSLKDLDLSFTSLSGELPNSIGYLKSLNDLDLSFTSLSGELPNSIGYLKSLNYLDLSFTSLSGELPNSIGYLKSLNYLDLSFTSLSGELPNSIGYLKSLNYLDLSFTSLSGELPNSIGYLKSLNYLYLCGSKFLGSITKSLGNLAQITELALFENSFNGPFPCWVTNLTKLVYLDISNNELTGPIPSNVSGLQNLQQLVLSNNSLNGTLPSWLFTNLVNLTKLDLSSNNLSGVVELHTFANLKNLQYLDLSYNNLSVSTISNINNTLPMLTSFYMSSCKIEEFPDFFKAFENLEALDISNNKIHGQVPKWVGVIGKDSLHYLNLSHNFLTSIKELPWKNLFTLDLHSNWLQGPLPIPPLSTSYLFISQNNLSGEIPSTICNLRFPVELDLSYNNLSGAIPQCLGYFSKSLVVLDLRSNGFQGTIPLTFAKGNQLRNLDLNRNKFEGPVPRSLSNCTQLQVLDLGNNMINDAFPNWLETLRELQVLILRSNRFHGPIDTSKTNLSFPKLRIVDLSHNNFNGHLPNKYFKKFEAMKNETMLGIKYMGDQNGYYQDSVAVTMKGLEIELVHILTVFTTIDLSSNNFSGEIPSVIGRLDSLIVLNLSYNQLNGHIPESLGDLTKLESLDLSSNHIVGKIPNQLKSLTFLEVFNLSWNYLDGPIPRGNQFNTFESDSYVGNSGLCGPPLSKKCEGNQAQVQPGLLLQKKDDLDFANGFTWKAVAIGYGCGMPLGLVIGYFVFLTGRPKFFARIVGGEKHTKVKRLKKFGHRQGGRRN